MIRSATTINEQCPACQSENVSPCRGAREFGLTRLLRLHWRRVFKCHDCETRFAIRVQVEILEPTPEKPTSKAG